MTPLAIAAAVLLPMMLVAQENDTAVTFIGGIPYREEAGLDEYTSGRCRLDLFLPQATSKPFPVLVWFHGGGLEGGDKASGPTKAVAQRFASAGIAVASAGYRLSPTVKAPTYVQDAAAAVAWIVRNIASHGGDPRSVFISGHSAGGYLAALLGADPSHLAAVGVPQGGICGIVPVSGQVFTHFTITKERGVADSRHTPVIDAYAPAYHAARAKDMPPLLLLCGDHDWEARAEENRYWLAMLKAAGAADATYLEVPDRTHGSILAGLARPDDPAAQAVIAFVAAHRR